jgi:16S rRNA A1518/A1519 N6-dimethyltransferase RsmA/KsgA/DIM1 with predicted DNA glycosylase/AP lyase activity
MVATTPAWSEGQSGGTAWKVASPITSARSARLAAWQAFLELVRAGFGQPRKQLVNSLLQGLQQANLGGRDWARTDAQALLANAGIDAERRPQALALTEWRDLFAAYQR